MVYDGGEYRGRLRQSIHDYLASRFRRYQLQNVLFAKWSSDESSVYALHSYKKCG
jgi:hypothetical protein